MNAALAIPLAAVALLGPLLAAIILAIQLQHRTRRHHQSGLRRGSPPR